MRWFIVLYTLQQLRTEVANSLPPEPGADCQSPTCFLKVRVPGGKILSRKFLQSTTLHVLFDYLFSEGFSRDTHKFLTSYPKRDVRK